jgi:hypothetical protein
MLEGGHQAVHADEDVVGWTCLKKVESSFLKEEGSDGRPEADLYP